MLTAERMEAQTAALWLVLASVWQAMMGFLGQFDWVTDDTKPADPEAPSWLATNLLVYQLDKSYNIQ